MPERMKTTVRRVGTSMHEARSRHQERHRPSGFRFALFDSIRVVRPDHWNALVAGRSVRLSRPSPGRTALQPKAKLGAKPQPLFCLLRHRIQAMNLVVGSLLRTLPEPEDAPERNPFK